MRAKILKMVAENKDPRGYDNADIAEYKDMILGLVPYTKGVKVNSKDAKIRLRVF